MTSQSRVIWNLEWFEKSPSERFAGEAELVSFTEADMIRIFAIQGEYGGGIFLVSERERESIQKFADHVISLDDYDYFVGPRAVVG